MWLHEAPHNKEGLDSLRKWANGLNSNSTKKWDLTNTWAHANLAAQAKNVILVALSQQAGLAPAWKTCTNFLIAHRNTCAVQDNYQNHRKSQKWTWHGHPTEWKCLTNSGRQLRQLKPSSLSLPADNASCDASNAVLSFQACALQQLILAYFNLLGWLIHLLPSSLSLALEIFLRKAI